MNKICVYAICKNESQFVKKWAKSMMEADSVVVLDTGSSDDTVEKLKSFGIKVEQKLFDPWRFDVARNESMKLIPEDCNILVCTDLDEVIDPGWADVLREKWVEGVHTRCWYKFVWSHLPDGSDGRIFWQNKIHGRGYKWRFPVHEQLYATTECKGTEVLTIDETYFKIHHYPVAKKSRTSYLPLLEMRVKDFPDDLSGWHYLTHQYYYDGHYDKCIDCGIKTLSIFNKALAPIEKANICLFIGCSYKNLNDEVKALKYFYKGIEEDSTYRENYLEISEIMLYSNNIENKNEKAYDMLKSCLKNTSRHYSWLEKDDSFTSRPCDLLSLAAYYCGKKKESLFYAFLAREYDKDNERLNNNVKIIMDNLTEKELIF